MTLGPPAASSSAGSGRTKLVVICDAAMQQLAFTRISTLASSPAFTSFGRTLGAPTGDPLGRPASVVAVGASIFVVARRERAT